MRALRSHTGSLDDLHVEEVSMPSRLAGEVLIRAAAVNPSDVKKVQAKMRETNVPRIPGHLMFPNLEIARLEG